MGELVTENPGVGGGQFVYVCGKEGVSIRRYRGTGTVAAVPAQIGGAPVVCIERKAFLSCKTVREIVLPDTVAEIGDWAFAHAEQLRTVRMPRREMRCGKEMFLGCKRLREIALSDCAPDAQGVCGEDGLGRMLAMAVTVLHDYFLFSPMEAGSDMWVAKWDQKLLGLLATYDLEGFEELWTCGEEDYEGKDYDIKSYPVEKRKMKLRIVYFRLLHPYKLSDAVRDALEAYLAAHTKGTAEPEAWDILLEEHKEELAYYEAFARAGGVTEENFDGLLADMAGVGAEIKAYLIRYREEHFGARDAFAAFELDW